MKCRKMTKDWSGNSKSTFITIGASNHTDKEREEHDFYSTSPEAIDKLLKSFSLPKKYGSALVVLDACQSVLSSSNTMS